MEFSRPEYWSVKPFPPPGDLPNPGIEPRSPALQTDSLPAEPAEKPNKTGVDRLSLLQQIFLTKELNQGLLHCRWILYQLSYQGSKAMAKSPLPFRPHSSMVRREGLTQQLLTPLVQADWPLVGTLNPAAS